MDTSGRPATPLSLIRRYVTDYINRHDFSVLPQIMVDDYRLLTGGLTISGRDGPYRGAVAKQLAQFPGLMFTPHELLWSGDRIAVRFTEHGASQRDAGARASWPSIAIYTVRLGMLVTCEIEQDYMSRRRQLQTGIPVRVDSPAIAPWDVQEAEPDAEAEMRVKDWLGTGAFIDDEHVQVDDSRATGRVERILEHSSIHVTALMSGNGKVAFHAAQHGTISAEFARDLALAPDVEAVVHLSGLVTVGQDGRFAGNIIRDRWGLYRRLSARN